MSGAKTGPTGFALRAGLAACEPFYSTAVRLRNRLFDVGLRRTHRLPVPVVSIGNITTGGTGKTPMVQWLADQLRRAGRQPAILSRGYRAKAGSLGDELTMLERSLNDGSEPPIPIRANPDRVAAGTLLLRKNSGIDVILLDDGFQHRRLARDLDIVLISAANPFGFDHVLPRGLLREPMAGLLRAGAIVITHADQVAAARLTEIEAQIRRHAPDVAIHRAVHEQFALHDGTSERAMEELTARKVFLFSGIADPEGFARQLSRIAAPVGSRWFPDHHDYTPADMQSLDQSARSAKADLLVTTEKDWVKIEPLNSATSLPIWRVRMRIRFLEESGQSLLAQILAVSSRR
jgi:tetraacyldisaccharide 4'-kinase